MDFDSIKSKAVEIKETAKEIARPTKRGYYIESRTIKSILEGIFCVFFPVNLQNKLRAINSSEINLRKKLIL
jgi:hypothetical protein